MSPDVPGLTAPLDAVSQAPSAADEDPLWYKDAIIYQAHVKAFFDSSNDGIGDFQGLTQKLDYLQGLGVTCLWLLPFFPSPLRDDGYDIADYLNVHPSYGTIDDFKAFVRAAHDRHIKVLIELVVNHTSNRHPWFERARHAPPDSAERNFYVWSDTDKKFPETRIIFSDTETSNWTFDPVAGQYYWHRFFSHQPDLNLNNPTVVDEVIGVMTFWLELGVDALRLDAVPYLCVREGTSNENLPETHAVLKRIRRELDRSFPNRMLLAEANQWPSDARAYFGDGDECHMAFHFALMPRMFMAIRQEERHAITEILSQTPDIPETCQWALFLRNHDELTLEMVTDEERDYMYSVYAADPQMRLNSGIRRRLAPLVENSRRRVELLNNLLFSLPGTPIVYYGDEIGMGDNIYLGDRNGVRTPMQWSGDRNAGFSRADPARLYAPPIMDPVYGYQAINVEAQERFPFSLLNWMRRLVAMRRQHRVFGRGSLEFVGCPNRKILAYLRRDDRETILVVANLSRTVQPAELDLGTFAGLIPVEMSGLTEFPRITEQPFPMTLGPYASYWFTLQRESIQMTPKVTSVLDPDAAIVDALPALLVGVDWQNLLDSGTRLVLERQALKPFLQRQHWFAQKSREIRHARFSDWATLRGGAHPAFITVVTVECTDGWTERYVVPLAMVSEDAAAKALKQTPAAVLARIAGARKGAVVDGLQDDDTCARIVGTVDRQDHVVTRIGQIRGVLTSSPIPWTAEHTWVRGSTDQSNSLVFADDRHVLKLFRRVEPSRNPEFEIGLFLREQGFTRIPTLVGALEYEGSGGEPGTLAVVQSAVHHQGSAWEHAIDELRRYYERVAARVRRTEQPVLPEPTDEGPPPFFTALEHWFLAGASRLGKRTAELHLALAGLSDARPAADVVPQTSQSAAASLPDGFVPEPLSGPALVTLANEMCDSANRVLDLLQTRLGSIPEAARPPAEALLALRATVCAHFDRVRLIEAPGCRIRVHGTYHLGQILRTEEDVVVLDFEGEPARSISERREKQSPLKDVAGMVRSFSYAAYAALFAFTVHAPDDYPALEPWADTWQHWVSDAFLRSYRATLAEAPIIPTGGSFDVLLRAFALDKGLDELAYELNNRPEWIRIPLAGLLTLLR